MPTVALQIIVLALGTLAVSFVVWLFSRLSKARNLEITAEIRSSMDRSESALKQHVDDQMDGVKQHVDEQVGAVRREVVELRNSIAVVTSNERDTSRQLAVLQGRFDERTKIDNQLGVAS